jgi:hypothetical protein
MEIDRMLAELRAERNRLDRAITALEALDGTGARTTTLERRARPTATADQPATKQPPARRRMSAAGRKRISEAAKKMWAERRKATAIPSPRRAMSAATKRKLSRSAKARWSEQQKKAKTT